MTADINSTSTEYYRDRIVRALVMFSIAWAIIGMAVGVYVAAELIWPTIDFGQQWLSYGRLRTLHTNGIIFGFGVSALMGSAARYCGATISCAGWKYPPGTTQSRSRIAPISAASCSQWPAVSPC